MKLGIAAFILAALAAPVASEAIIVDSNTKTKALDEATDAFFVTIATGFIEEVNTLLAQGKATAGLTNSLGRTALHVAAATHAQHRHGRAMVQALLNYGVTADAPDAAGETALLAAIAHATSFAGNDAVIDLLLQATLAKCADVAAAGEAARGEAVRCARPHAREALFHAAANAKPEQLVVPLIHEALKERTQDAHADAFAHAAIRGDADAVEELLLSQEQEGTPPGTPSAEAGLRRRIAPTTPSVAGAPGWVTPLHLAAAIGHAQVVERFLSSDRRKRRVPVDHLWACLFATMRRGNGALAEVVYKALQESESGPGLRPPDHPLFQRATWDQLNTSDTAAMARAWESASGLLSIDCAGTTLADKFYPSAQAHLRGVVATTELAAGQRVCRVPQRVAISLEVAQLMPPLVDAHETCVMLAGRGVGAGGGARFDHETCDVFTLSVLALYHGRLTASYLMPFVRLHLAEGLAEGLPLAHEETAGVDHLEPSTARRAAVQRAKLLAVIEAMRPRLLRGDLANELRAELCTEEEEGGECDDVLARVFSARGLQRMSAVIIARTSMVGFGVFYPVTASNHLAADPGGGADQDQKGMSLVTDLPNHAHLAFTREGSPAGGEILFSYGRHCKEQFYVTYGFAPTDAQPC